MTIRLAHVAASTCVIATCLAFAGKSARAQAWVPDRGSVSAGLDYNLAISDRTETNTTEVFEDTGTTSHQVTLSAEYAPIQKLAVSASLPYVAMKYTGTDSFAHGPWDDGKTHSTLTDLRAGVRYQILEDPVAISPHLAFTIPVSDYATYGNTAAGRHLKMAHAGVGIGYILGLSTYFHGIYEFTLAEKYDVTPDTKKYSQNRSDFGVTIGHVLNSIGLDMHVDANIRLSHDGVNIDNTYFMRLTPDEQMYHDAILEEAIVLVGGGLGYNITKSLSATLAARFFVRGNNTQNTTIVAAGVSWAYPE